MAHPLSGKSVLVTGAAGCIGSWVVKELLETGANPVVFDLSENRARMNLIMGNSDMVHRIKGDITDYNQIVSALKSHEVFAIIHLAALQVPFAKANPILGTNVNVMGTTHIFEAARTLGIDRIAYASSIAAPAMGDNDHLATLYGAHKVCNEQMAAVYWQDWQVPSVCIRPGVIYGPGRDQGMSAAPTIAMLAAFAGQEYSVPFIGLVSYIHAQDAALRFIGAISRKTEGAPVFDMNGVVVDMADVMGAIQNEIQGAKVQAVGHPLPFPALSDDGELDGFIGASPHRSFVQGVSQTLEVYEQARQRGLLTDNVVTRLIGNNS